MDCFSFATLSATYMKLTTIKINTPAYEDMIALRLRVLLNPIGVPASYINPEKEKGDTLIGAYNEHQLIGCCVLTHLSNTTLQLRQMAVDDRLQKSGTGRAIIAYAEQLAKEADYQKLMMHARDAVIPFYEKCGYTISGEQFFEVGIAHHKMEKEL